MPYMVIYGTADGAQEMHEIGDLADAVGFVEQLRNEQSVEAVRMLEVTELNFGFKPYYRVEISNVVPAPAGSSLSAPPPDAPVEAPPAETNGAAGPFVGLPEPAGEDVPAAFPASDVRTDSDSEAVTEDLVWGSGLATACADEEPSESVDEDVDAEPQRRGLFGR